MRRVRLSCAMSLDGYIAGPGGEFDGLPLLPRPAGGRKLRLEKHRVYEKTGTALLDYTVE